jgi:hypothetical protein
MPATIEELLDAFEQGVKNGLDSFLLPKGAVYESGFSMFEGRITRLKKRTSQIPGLFWFLSRYSLPTLTLEIGYGDKEMLVEAKLHYPQYGVAYPPALIAEAARTSEDGTAGAWCICELTKMRQTVASLCDGLKRQWHLFEHPGGELIDRVQRILARRLIVAEEEQRKRDRERDSIQAASAFHSRDYARIIALLSPYAADAELSKSSKMTLALAKKRLKK